MGEVRAYRVDQKFVRRDNKLCWITYAYYKPRGISLREAKEREKERWSDFIKKGGKLNITMKEISGEKALGMHTRIRTKGVGEKRWNNI